LEPLRRRLELLGARHVGHATPKPGRGAPSRAQVFRVSEAGLGRLLADLPAPVMLTAIELEDGRTVTGLTEQT
jgi:allophanate hydrolase